MKISFDQQLSKLPSPATEKWPEGIWFNEAWRQGEMSLELYAPKNRDYQTPHSQDELYVVVRGRGTFQLETEQIEFAPGDVLIVPAGKVHRFSQFSGDFAAWVVFWGPHKVIAK